MRIIYLLAVMTLLPICTVSAQDEEVEECCEIVAIDAQEGTIRLEIGDSDKTITLQIGSGDLFGSMQIGQMLGFDDQDDWDSLEEGESLTPTSYEDWDADSFEECCNVVDMNYGFDAEVFSRQLAEGITLEVVELRRVNDKVLHFAFAVDNQTEETVDLMALGILRWVGSGPTKQATGIELHDLVGLKYYRAGKASQSRDLDVPPQSRREYWAQYQSPPEGVMALTVTLPDAPPLYDVPVQ